MLKLKLQYLATSCEELTYWKRLWYWEGLGAGGEGDDRGWDGWMTSPTQWTWVWVKSRSWWGTGRPGVLQFMRSQRVRHNWVTEMNWTELNLTHSSSMREVACSYKLFLNRLYFKKKFPFYTLNLAFLYSFKVGNSLYKIEMVYHKYVSSILVHWRIQYIWIQYNIKQYNKYICIE